MVFFLKVGSDYAALVGLELTINPGWSWIWDFRHHTQQAQHHGFQTWMWFRKENVCWCFDTRVIPVNNLHNILWNVCILNLVLFWSQCNSVKINCIQLNYPSLRTCGRYLEIQITFVLCNSRCNYTAWLTGKRRNRNCSFGYSGVNTRFYVQTLQKHRVRWGILPLKSPAVSNAQALQFSEP